MEIEEEWMIIRNTQKGNEYLEPGECCWFDGALVFGGILRTRRMERNFTANVFGSMGTQSNQERWAGGLKIRRGCEHKKSGEHVNGH